MKPALPLLLAAALAAPALAARPPALPPLVLDAVSPVVSVGIDGGVLLLRVDPGSTRFVQINADAAARLDLANPARLVAGKPADIGRITTQVGRVLAHETTTDAVGRYADRDLPIILAWSSRNHVAGADGTIGPMFLPHDEIRFHRRAPAAGDRTTHLAMTWSEERGLSAAVPLGGHRIDLHIEPGAAETIATASAAAWLIESNGGRLDGEVRDAIISQGVERPVRDVVLGRPASFAGFTIGRVATRLFDWSGATSLPADPVGADEIVVRARYDAQRQWPKLAIGGDHLAACAEIVWHRAPLAIDLVCPG